jgi:monovalent cation:H+ antiporter, CPA1 family
MRYRRVLLLLIFYGTLLAILSGCSVPAGIATQTSVTQPAAISTPLPPEEVLPLPMLRTGLRHPPGPIVQMEFIVVVLLLIAATVSVVTQRLHIPYTIGLVIVGLGLTLLEQLPSVNITPELILALLVPPLVYEAAFLLDFADLRRELRLVISLAVPGVILTTFLVGGVVSLGAGVALPYALVFGALIAATDPVAVVALFRSMGAPKRLQVLLEGESLLNDGTAIMLFNMMLIIALTGQFNIGKSVVQFFVIAGGGILVGVVMGMLISALIGQINNALVETTLTIVLAYGSYILADYVFGVSGVLAVVAAGLASGQIGPRGMTPTTRIVVFNFWETIAFLANSVVFLAIGLKMDINILVANIPAILWAILAVLVARAVTVFVLSALHKGIPTNWKMVLFWGGLRGAISLALALSLSDQIPHPEQLQAMAFGVVLFTLVVEGLTMQPLIKGAGVSLFSAFHQEYDRRHARAVALRAAQSRLQRMHHEGVISEYTQRRLGKLIDERLHQMSEEVRASLESEPGLYQEELADAWIETLRAQRSALTGLFHNNIITEDVYAELVAEVDASLVDPEAGWKELNETLESKQ